VSLIYYYVAKIHLISEDVALSPRFFRFLFAEQEKLCTFVPKGDENPNNHQQ